MACQDNHVTQPPRNNSPSEGRLLTSTFYVRRHRHPRVFRIFQLFSIPAVLPPCQPHWPASPTNPNHQRPTNHPAHAPHHISTKVAPAAAFHMNSQLYHRLQIPPYQARPPPPVSHFEVLQPKGCLVDDSLSFDRTELARLATFGRVPRSRR